MEKDQLLEIGKVDEIPIGKMKHVEVNGKEIVISNVGGNFYAMDDRCGHMNARLSARFDVTTGKKIKEPVLTHTQQMEPLPKTWQNYLEHAGELMSYIKTYDQQTYEVKVEGNVIKIRI